MKKTMIALMAVVAIAAIVVSAEEALSDELSSNAQINVEKASETKLKAREQALLKKKQEWETQKEQAKKEFKEKYDKQ